MSEHLSVLSIDCCDGRMSKCGNGYGGARGDGWTQDKCPGLTKGAPIVRVYSLSSPGPNVTPDVVSNAVTMLRGGFGLRSVRLVTHADCGASKLETGLPVDRALSADESARVEARTAARRKEAVAQLLASEAFVHCLADQKRPFRVGHWDIAAHRVIWLLDYDHASGKMVAVPAEAAQIDSDEGPAVQPVTVRESDGGRP